MPTSNFDTNSWTYAIVSKAQSMATNWAELQSSLSIPITEADPKKILLEKIW